MNKNKIQRGKNRKKVLKRALVSCGTTSCSLGKGDEGIKICIWRNNSYTISKFDEHKKPIDPGILMDPKYQKYDNP